MLNHTLEGKLNTTAKHLQKLTEKLKIKTVGDLLQYYPRAYNDTATFTKISEIRTDQINTLKGRLTTLFNIRTKRGKQITRGLFEDESGTIEVIWFNQPHLSRMLPRNSDIILSGKAKFSFGKTSLQNPSHELIRKDEEQVHAGRIVPVYHETEGLSSKWLREKIKPLLKEWADHFKEFLPAEILETNDFLPLKEAIKQIHFPKNDKLLKKARKRLAFDELFLLQLKVLQKKWHWQNIAKKDEKKITIKAEEIKKLLNSLPFKLTNAQRKVLKETLSDMQKPLPMTRLLQGDVGCGKTIVSAITALNTVLNGYQVCLMAPTEILAKQHFEGFISTLKNFSLNIQFIAGSTSEKQKQEIVRQMKSGTCDIAIGTHALIQERIGFKNLGLAIIDEQHRFGVKQRNTLKKYGNPHLLSMTATPIPRTLAITIYGDQDLSIIDEMPKGRQSIITKHVPEKKRNDAYRWIEEQIKKGRQTFIVCPLIEESEILNLKSVIKEFEYLSNEIFPTLKLQLLHGKLRQEDKDQIMQDFKENKINILVSTSVIEVGIDVPNATIMLIEGAERFGLSQLHQFRGRVGRGVHQSYCFLFTNTLSEEGKTRMQSMEKHTSGFKLAEIDLNLRGPGEIYGVKQSGIPDLKMASLTDCKSIELARKNAINIIKKDPLLKNHERLAEKIAEIQEVYEVD